MTIRFLLLLFICPFLIKAEIRLPELISDGMVLQRNTDLIIWGWASNGEQVKLNFLDAAYQTTANEAGEWEIKLHDLSAGGPFDMTIDGSNHIVIHDILIGDVWLCSGQSNMELPLRRVWPRYPDVIKNATNPGIRYFEVPKTYNFSGPLKTLSGGSWQHTTPENAPEFSALAYFFAQELYSRYHIPIGLVNSSLGGSPAEAWMSETALKKFPVHYEELQKFKDSTYIANIERSDRQRQQQWHAKAVSGDQGLKGKDTWANPSSDLHGWDTTAVPGYWANSKLGPLNGVVWYRRNMTLPDNWESDSVMLNLGRIVDADSTFINGLYVGNTTYQYPPRWYSIPKGILKSGENTIAVRVTNEQGRGGFVPEKPYLITNGQDTIHLEGTWNFKVGVRMPALAGPTFIRWKPGGLYNAMIAPLLNLRFKGVIWYQGESNAGRAKEYNTLFPAMINDWREHFGRGNFPFLFVQLANFLPVRPEPSESDWAELREAQTNALSLPNTGMAVIIDIGEGNDIHPLNKKEAAHRLALTAFKQAYNESIESSGPAFSTMKIEGNQIIVTFDHANGGLISKGSDSPGAFAIAGKDGHYVWAQTKIKGNHVVAWNDKIDHPVSIRYAWADNPEDANLYNKQGLPAIPFRTSPP